MVDSSERIKIIRVIARLNIGGPAVHTILLTQKMQNDCYHNVLVSGKEGPDEGSMDFLARQHGVQPIILPGLGREISLLDDLKTLIQLYRLFRREKPTIVETHTAKAGTVGRLAAFLARVPVRIHFFHGHVLYGYFGRLKTWVFKVIERLMAIITHRIVACSEKVRQDLIRFHIASPGKIVTIPYGFPLEKFVGAAHKAGQIRKQMGLTSEAKVVGIVARLVPIKGHEVFLEAIELLLQKGLGLSVHAWIVGDGERREELKAMAQQLQIQDHVSFLAWREDIENVYADLDVLALTSFNEGLPLVIIEAMAAGKPIVATNVGGVPEMVFDGQNGFVVPVGDSQAIADRLEGILCNSPKGVEMGKAGQKFALEHFSTERLTYDLDLFYQSLIVRG